MLHLVQVLVGLGGLAPVKTVPMMEAQVVKAFQPSQVAAVAPHSAPVERVASVAVGLLFADVAEVVDTLVGPEEMVQAAVQVVAVAAPTMQEATKATVLVFKVEMEWLRSVGKPSLASNNRYTKYVFPRVDLQESGINADTYFYLGVL